MGLNFSKKMSRVFIFISILIFSLVFFLYLCSNNFVYLIILLGLSLFLSKKIKHFGLTLFLISFFVRLAFIIIFKFPQLDDFATLLDASHMFSRGDFSFNTWFHFHTWGYQTGFVIYQGFLLKLFNSEFLLKLLNIIYSSCLVLFIYKVGRRVSDEKSARFVSLLYMVFPFHVFLNSIMANHHLATLLMYLGILFLIKKDKSFKDYIIGGVLISLGNIIRPEGIIVVFSFLVYEFFLLDKKKVINTLVRVCAFLAIYFSIGFGASFLVIKSGVNPSGLSNKDPLWKFILGFNYNTCGYYEDSDSQYQINRETEINIIKERALSNLPRTGKLMLCKIDRFWLQSDLNLETGQYNDKTINVFGFDFRMGDLLDKVISVNGYIYMFIFSMFLLGIFINRKRLSNEALFFIIMCVVTFFVFLLIEIQPRYAYFIHISIFILASMGVKFIFDFISKLNIKYLKKVL
jgi:hypothetical protein